MKFTYVFILLFVMLTACFAANHDDICVTDGLNQRVCVTKPATRLITLAPDLVEDLFAVGAGKYIVGTTTFSNYPESAKSIPVVADYSAIDGEAIMVLDPDLILAWYGGNAPSDIAELKSFGLPIYENKISKWQDIPQLFVNLGILTGHIKIAEQVAKQFSDKMRALKQQYQKASTNRANVMIEINHMPIMVMSNHSLIGRMIAFCGGHNVFANLKTPSATILATAVIAAKPDIIINLSDKSNVDLIKQWKTLYPQNKYKIYTIPTSLLTRFGPRFTQGVSKLCHDINDTRIST